MWFEVAVVASLFALGNILFGHFEAETPKWRRVLKFLIVIALSVVVSATAGRTWFLVLMGIAMLVPLMIHLWWLPRRGINGWTAEPREKYYELRGWKMRDSAR